jgi:hypothetical protein
MHHDSSTPGRSRSFGSTLVAVAWSFVGLRRRKDFDQDVGGLNPLYVLAAALAGVGVLILCLLAIVHLVVK